MGPKKRRAKQGSFSLKFLRRTCIKKKFKLRSVCVWGGAFTHTHLCGDQRSTLGLAPQAQLTLLVWDEVFHGACQVK